MCTDCFSSWRSCMRPIAMPERCTSSLWSCSMGQATKPRQHFTYIPRTEGQAFSDQLLARAGTCAHLVSTSAHLLDSPPLEVNSESMCMWPTDFSSGSNSYTPLSRQSLTLAGALFHKSSSSLTSLVCQQQQVLPLTLIFHLPLGS